MQDLRRATGMLPEWMRSARWRITILYSTVLFLVASLLLAAVYVTLHVAHDEEAVTKPYEQTLLFELDTLTGEWRPTIGERLSAQELEQRINRHTLDKLRSFSFGALGVLFLISLGVGWVISGRVLRPIDRITGVAKRIQATDLSQRIDLEGPDDELKRLADTFDGMLARLDEAFAQQRRFVTDASHELRNPLAVIRTNLDVDLADPNADAERLRRTATVVRRATERMSRLVDDLLALARLDEPPAPREVVDVSEVAGEVADELAAVAASRGVIVERDVGPATLVRGDSQSLKRAVVNLVDNAIRFSPDASLVSVATGTVDEWAFVAVADRGPGIDPGDQPYVFDRFWRADKARSRAQGGSGLGLAIVRQIVEAHGGSVRLFSEPGRGATFVIWLPGAGALERDEPLPDVPDGSPIAPRVGA